MLPPLPRAAIKVFSVAGMELVGRAPIEGEEALAAQAQFTDLGGGMEALLRILTLDQIHEVRGARGEVAEAPWSAAEWAVALLFVELLQALFQYCSLHFH